MTKKENFVLILILGALCTISPFSIDMYLPGFPAIAENLGTTIYNVQLSLTAYLVGIAIGQLFYGPLLDKYGRKKPLYVGLVIYILTSIACAYTYSVDHLIVMRFLQAIGGCVGMVAAQALVRDLFPSSQTAQVLSLLTLVIAVSPMVAPTLGGYVTAHFSWKMVFWILAGITFLILIGIRWYLPAGAHPDNTISLRPRKVVYNYLTVLKNRQFLVYMTVGGIAGAAPFAYIAGSADVFINRYGVSETEYGWIFALLATAMIGSTQMNHLLLKRFSSEQIIRVSLLYQSVVGMAMVIGVWMQWLNVYSLIFLMFIFLTGHGLNSPNTAALSLEPFSKNAGSASAMMGSVRMAMGGLASAMVSIFHTGTALPMVMMMAACAVVGALILNTEKFFPSSVATARTTS
ncbi:MAG TPA: Bcr/CflA family multidrug efflux MFS transporter [Cyclobacteriaceae bacterium]|nr:Bcr/CflA family multidrug efflux MFS transporter [Cyclobacteriaceae bacterium]